ncbi:PKD domain-containing protein [Desulfogranum marinum]|uniref:PKD domain-containing protein n=1 Tax=Desulfogranum marinum TaxID=453220 RepID=UPI0019644D7F|nr:PKD domain-containing protein [Desulfogranum marinum]MBM9513983.1 PKD domain-containing protein [Desulfogranum marinum]
MLKKLLQILLTFACCTFATMAAAADHSIHIEWGYTPPSEPAVTGYRLYKEGTFSCETQNPLATSMDCSVSLEQDTTNFTLTALFDDGSESPHSASFPFTVADETTPPDETPEPETSGSHAFTFTWETNTSTDTISEHRVYLNDEFLCASSEPTATSLTCNADLVNGLMTFSMTTVDTNGLESAPSNILTFDPTEYPTLFNPKQVAFSWEYPDATDLAGFKIYHNSSFLCETTNPEDRTLTCTANFTSSANTFAIAAVDINGTETTLSNTLTYTEDSTSATTQLLAAITSNATEGTAPLTVAFDGSSSTGDITSYAWSFGDGDTADANNINHTFTLPGTYTAKLTITDSNGNTSSDTATITVTEAVVANTPPIAAINPSATTGEAPLTITFDGSGSTDSDGTISSYTWNFGDGSSATGKQVSHTFTDAGTFTAGLLVADDQGLTSTTSVPIIATAPVQETNQPPVAAIGITTSTGKAPLTVSFSASSSTDPDGTIENYTWNFGDGSSASGVSATHTYTTEADYIATLQVMDDKGMTATARTTIAVDPAEENTPFAIEIGEVVVNSTWKRVELEKSFTDPIIIVGPPSFNDSEPGVLRLRNIDTTGFEIRFTEWDYLDDKHVDEIVSYLVVEKGHHTYDGTTIEAGSIRGTTNFTTYNFETSFAGIPVVMTTVASANETDTIAGRLKNISDSGFEYYFREQEKNKDTHIAETVHYIAWQQGSGNIDTINFEAATTADAITQEWTNIAYSSKGETTPYLLADMQTTDGKDSSALRAKDHSTAGFDIKVEEEQSSNTEISHTSEVVGYLALTSNLVPQTPPTKLVTFNWVFPTESENTITSFRMYVNGEVICEEPDVSARTISCETQEEDTYTFQMTAVTILGEETNLSNQLQLTQ